MIVFIVKSDRTKVCWDNLKDALAHKKDLEDNQYRAIVYPSWMSRRKFENLKEHDGE